MSLHPVCMGVVAGNRDTKLPDPTGAKEQSRANLVMALVRGFVAALVFGLGVFFVIDARSLWIRRDDNCGEQV